MCCSYKYVLDKYCLFKIIFLMSIFVIDLDSISETIGLADSQQQKKRTSNLQWQLSIHENIGQCSFDRMP